MSQRLETGPRLRGSEEYTIQDQNFFGSRGKHALKIFQYPADLHKQDLLHYVEFAINVRGKSKYNNENRAFSVTPTSDNKLTPEAVSTVATVGTAAAVGIAAGALTGTLVSRYVERASKTGAPVNPKLAGVAGTLVGAAAATGAATFVNANDMTRPDTSQRITDVINLHVDGPPAVRYGMKYSNKDLGTLAGIIGTGFGEGSLASLKGVGEASAAALTAFAKLPAALGATDVRSALSASAKTSLNPFSEVIFESVDFRSFAFKYRFFPKNKQESDSVRAIINLFKFHMHPEMSASKLFYIYPSEFQITYFFNKNENTYTHKFLPCVLESMEVSYGGDQFSTFKDGNPTEINVTLLFRETELLTKKTIMDAQGDL